MANKENVRKWVEALRSGVYPQTQNRLRDAKGYCCLGVACDVSGVGEWVNRFKDINYPQFFEYSTDDAKYLASSVLPPAVIDWFGFDRSNPKVEFSDKSSKVLTELNDCDGFDFKQIADLIEKTYLMDE